MLYLYITHYAAQVGASTGVAACLCAGHQPAAQGLPQCPPIKRTPLSTLFDPFAICFPPQVPDLALLGINQLRQDCPSPIHPPPTHAPAHTPKHLCNLFSTPGPRPRAAGHQPAAHGPPQSPPIHPPIERNDPSHPISLPLSSFRKLFSTPGPRPGAPGHQPAAQGLPRQRPHRAGPGAAQPLLPASPQLPRVRGECPSHFITDVGA